MDRALTAGTTAELLLDDAGIYQIMANEGYDMLGGQGINACSTDLVRQISITTTTTNSASGNQQVTLSAASGTTDDGLPWTLAVGMTLVYDYGGTNVENAEILAVNGALATLNLTKTHNSGAVVLVDVYSRARQAPGQRGAMLVSSDGFKATYRYSSIGNTPAATPTDVFTIAGSATKTIRVKSVKLNGVATANGNMPVALIRRSALDTAGTSTAPTPIKHDVNDAAATAALALYTANPTGLGAVLGTNGIIAAQRLFLTTTATGQPSPTVFDFSTRQDKAVILRGATDVLAVNLQGAAVPAGGLFDIEVEWEEDAS